MLALLSLSACTHSGDRTYSPSSPEETAGGTGIADSDTSVDTDTDTDPSPIQPPGPIEHILLISNDTLRWDMITPEVMPKLSARVHAEGILLTQEWNLGYWTRHTMPGLMTGKTVVDLGPDIYQQNLPQVANGETTIAEMLGGNGFSTYFDNANDICGSQINMLQGYDLVVERDHDNPGDFGTAGAQGDRMLAWTKQQTGKWFGHIHTFDSHDPYNWLASTCEANALKAAESCPYDVINGATDGMNSYTFTSTQQDLCAAAVTIAHHCEGTSLDSLVDTFLIHMEANGLLDKTLIILTADHGEGYGEHSWNHHQDLYAPVTRGFTWFWYPGINGFREIKTPTSQMDVVPTILAFAGLKTDVALDGSPVDAIPSGRIVKHFACDPNTQLHGAVSANGTRHLLLTSRDAGDAWELYDPINDTLELSPLGETPSADLVAAIEAQRTQTESYCP